jgi:hypothetical protein
MRRVVFRGVVGDMDDEQRAFGRERDAQRVRKGLRAGLREIGRMGHRP